MSTTELEQGLLRLVAPNPSPLTAEGTNTYILGSGPATIIDPGPDLPAHFLAIEAALAGRDVEAILITHSHRDHCPLSAELACQTGAPVYAFGATGTGRSEIMSRLAVGNALGGGEGADIGFSPDVTLADGERLSLASGDILAIHTPGHFGNHLCFAWRDVLFSGDHVMGWSSTLVSPPDGDLTDFMASVRKLASGTYRRFYPGHGAPVTTPSDRMAWLLDHRAAREAQVLNALLAGPQSAAELAEQIYTDVSPQLWPAAARNVLAHLIDLMGRGRVETNGSLSTEAPFKLKKRP